MKLPTLREVGIEARLLLIGIPVLIWTMVPIYHMFLFAISPKQDAFAGKLWPDHPTLHNFKIVFYQQQVGLGCDLMKRGTSHRDSRFIMKYTSGMISGSATTMAAIDRSTRSSRR